MKRYFWTILALLWFQSLGFAQTGSSSMGGSSSSQSPTGQFGSGVETTRDCFADPLAPGCSTGGSSGFGEGARPSTDVRGAGSVIRYEDYDYPYSQYPGSSQSPSASSSEPRPQVQVLPAEPPTEFQRFVAESTGNRLPIFGASLFRQIPSTFTPNIMGMPVSSDYVVGAGDELRVRTWGQLNLDLRTIVDRSGQIYIPRVGSATVAGVKYAELGAALKRDIGKYYKNFDLDVSMGRLRSIQIFVVGFARRPGSYNVGSMSTLLNALFASGGPSSQGSLRNIQLKRNDKVVSDFDLYDLLLKGDKSKDAALQPGDVIFIPSVGPVVAMTGAVQTPAVYELKGKVTLGDALALVGGLNPTADAQKATVERIDDHRVRNVDEFLLDPTGLARELKGGDVVQVISIIPKFENAVTIRGNVANPGRYPWREGMKLRDLIPNREFLLTREYWRNQNKIGARLPDRPETTIADQQMQMMAARPALAASPQQPAVAGDQTQPQVMMPAVGEFGLAAALNSATRSGNVESLAGATVPTGAQQAATSAAPGANAVTAAQRGRAPRAEDITLEIKRSAPDINWDYGVIQRLNPYDLTTQLVPFNPGRLILQNDESQNLPLKAGDIVTIFSQLDLQVPMERRTKFVRVEGEVRSPGVYRVDAGDTLRSLVERAGGLTNGAFLYGTEFTRESLRNEQQRGLDATIRNVELSLAANGYPEGALVDKLRQLRATGRMVLEMRPSDVGVASFPQLVLEDGDRLAIPNKPLTVDVVGAVNNQSSYLFRPNKTVGEYLQMAGRGIKEADRKHMFLIRADGSVLSRNSGMWAGNLTAVHVLPGDVIVIPLKVSRGERLRSMQQWSTLFSQFALGAASLAVIGR